MLYFESETVLKFYNLKARLHNAFTATPEELSFKPGFITGRGHGGGLSEFIMLLLKC